jgi:NAD(P)-dependent dehydrogenase (short-subunit alcohol dehydrogenase family)
MHPYSNRHVVISGGTGALGTAVVEALLRAGAACHVPVRSEAAVSKSSFDRKRVSFVTVGDLADESAVTRFYDSLPELWASIHIAGGYGAAPIEKTDKASLQSQLDTNLVSAFVCSRAAVARIRKTGGGGRIVNVAARQALEPRLGAGSIAYTVSKAAVAALTAALGQEVAKEGILVNAVAPSILDTAANRASMPGSDFNAWPKVEEVADTILFLASPANTVSRGAVVPVYGRS